MAIEVTIAALHFVCGPHYKGPFPAFVKGYLLDILVPFAFYFLLCLVDWKLLKSWINKALLVFGAACAVEAAQYFGLPIFGRTFDILDFGMYALGILIAVLCDTIIFVIIFSFWFPEVKFR